MHDRQVVLQRGAPDRIEIGVIDRDLVRHQRHHRNRPARFAPFADLMDRGVDVAGRSDDHALQPVGILARKIAQMPVIGPDHCDFDARVVMSDKTGPGGRDQKMRVGPLVVHVLNAGLGLVVLHPGARHLAAHPMGIAPGMGLARRRLAEDPAIGDLAEAVDVAAGGAAGIVRSDRHAVCGQVGETAAEPRIDVFFEHLGRRFDMGIGVVYAQPILHHSPSLTFVFVLYTPGRGTETAAAAPRKGSTAANRSRNERGLWPWAERGRDARCRG